jgi:hypothetical protein
VTRAVLEDPSLLEASALGLALAEQNASIRDAARVLGNTGFVMHSVGLCSFCFARYGDEPMRALEAAIRAGGDTDTHAAIVGGWAFTLHGAAALPLALVDAIHDGPFGPTHLRALAAGLAHPESASKGRARHPSYSWPCALVRNLALYPVVLAHGLLRPFRAWRG